jgi:hypothetical protein
MTSGCWNLALIALPSVIWLRIDHQRKHYRASQNMKLAFWNIVGMERDATRIFPGRGKDDPGAIAPHDARYSP